MDRSEQSAVEWAWDRQSVWSQTADSLKAGPRRARLARLGLVVAASACALGAAQVESTSTGLSNALAVAGGLVMAVTGLLGGLQSIDKVRDWTRARSVSEAIKSEVFVFLTRTGPYATAEADSRLEAEVNRLEQAAGILSGQAEGKEPEPRKLPDVTNVESYLQVRVRQSQLQNYYSPKAKTMKRRVRQFKALEVAFALCAAGLAALAARAPTVGVWATVATTAVGATVAYVAAERFELLWVEYSRTAAELRRLLDRRTDPQGQQLPGKDLVAACEGVISVQNQSWMATWGEEEAPAGT